MLVTSSSPLSKVPVTQCISEIKKIFLEIPFHPYIALEDLLFLKLREIGILRSDGILQLDVPELVPEHNEDLQTLFIRLIKTCLSYKGLNENSLDEYFDNLKLHERNTITSTEPPLFTLEVFKRCIRRYDINQCVVDATLNILRYIRQPITPNDWAMTSLYLSQGAVLLSSRKKVQIVPNESLSMLTKWQGVHPTAVAFAAASISKIRTPLPLAEIESPFLKEIQRLMNVGGLPFTLIEALLCFASFVKVCHSSITQQCNLTVSVVKQSYFILRHEKCIFSVPIQPEKFSILLCNATEEQLGELKTLWNLLVPARVCPLTQQPFFVHVESFKIHFEKLINHSSPFLNEIAYISLLASQVMFAKPSGLDSIFKKLYILLPEGLPEVEQELLLISSFLTPYVRFIPSHYNRQELITSFIKHLFGNQLRFYGNAAFSSLPQEEKRIALPSLLHALLNHYPMYAIQLCKDHTDLIGPDFGVEFFFVVLERLTFLFPFISKKEIHILILLGNDLLPELVELEDKGQTLIDFITHATSFDCFLSLIPLLNKIANSFPHLWEEVSTACCKALRTKGPIQVLKTWEILIKIHPLQYRPEISYECQDNEVICLSESFLEGLKPFEALEAICLNYCTAIAKKFRDEIIQASFHILLSEFQEDSLLNLLTRYEFNENNCNWELLKQIFLKFFNEKIPKNNAIQKLYFFFKIIGLKTLIPLQNEIVSNIANHLKNLLPLEDRPLKISPAMPKLLRDVDTDNLFAAFKFAKKANRIRSRECIPLLFAFLPLLRDSRECKSMLTACLNKQKPLDRQKFFAAIFRTFRKSIEALQFILQLKDSTFEKVISATSHLLFKLPKEELLAILQEHQSDFAKNKQSSILSFLTYALVECVKASLPFAKILQVMSHINVWPDSVLQIALKIYPPEDTYQELLSMHEKGQLTVSEAQQKEYFKQLFSMMLEAKFDSGQTHAEDWDDYLAIECDQGSSWYPVYVKALQKAIQHALETEECKTMHSVMHFLHNLFKHNRLSANDLLSFYKLLFTSWRKLSSTDAFNQADCFCEDFMALHEESKYVVDELPFKQLLFITFFNAALINHQFADKTSMYLAKTVSFLLNLHEDGFFYGKSQLFFRSLNLLPLGRFVQEEDIDYLQILYDYVQVHVVRLQGLSFFPYLFNLTIHIEKLLSSDLPFKEIYRPKYKFIQLLIQFQKELMFKEQKNLLPLLQELDKPHTEEELILLAGTVNCLGSFLPYEQAAKLIVKVFDVVKLAPSSIYQKLLKILSPLNLELMKLQIKQGTPLIDFVSINLLLFSELPQSLEEIEESVAFFVSYIQSLADLGEATLFLQEALLQLITNNLKKTLKEGFFKEDTFPQLLLMIQELAILPDTTSSVCANYIARLLFCKSSEDSTFTSLPLIKAKCHLIVLCVLHLSKINQEISETFLLKGIKFLMSMAKKNVFKENPSALYKLFHLFTSCQVRLLSVEVQTNHFSKELILSPLTNSKLDSHLDYTWKEIIHEQLKCIENYFIEMNMFIEGVQEEQIPRLIHHLEIILIKHQQIMLKMIEKHSEEGFADYYFSHIESAIECYARLSYLQKKHSLVLTELFQPLIDNILTDQSKHLKILYKSKFELALISTSANWQCNLMNYQP